MLLKWISSNYFRLIGSLIVIGVVLFIFGLLLGGFNLNIRHHAMLAAALRHLRQQR